jgi:hypothetical protein
MEMTEVFIVDLGDSYERMVIGVATSSEAAIKIARDHAARDNYRSSVNFYGMRKARLDMVDNDIDHTFEEIEVE